MLPGNMFPRSRVFCKPDYHYLVLLYLPLLHLSLLLPLLLLNTTTSTTTMTTTTLWRILILHPRPAASCSLEDETPGQYRYALDSTGMLWAVPVCSGQYRFGFVTGMFWAVPVCCGQYRYCPEHTGTAQIILVLPRTYRYCPEHTGPKNKPVLPRAYQYCPEHTGTAQSIPVLSRAYRYWPGISSSRLYFLYYYFRPIIAKNTGNVMKHIQNNIWYIYFFFC